MKRIKRFGVLQTAKVSAIIYFLISAVFLLPMGFVSSMFGGENFPGLPFGGGTFFIFLPFLYAFFGFITTAIACLVYNLIAKWTGGIEFEVETADDNN